MNKWVVAVACGVINFLIVGLARLSPLLFVASMDRYNTNRQNASLPYVMAFIMRFLSGPINGIAGCKYGLRSTTLFGCFLAAIGVGGCFFAEDIFVVTLLWGLVYGLGFGFSTALLPSILNLHFKSNATLANGVALTGSSLGALTLPVIFKYFLDIYGMSGSQLILSAIALNSVPAALLLKTTKTLTSKKKNAIFSNSKCCRKFQSSNCWIKNKCCKYDLRSKDIIAKDTANTNSVKNFQKEYCNHAFSLQAENIKSWNLKQDIYIDSESINKKSMSIQNFNFNKESKPVISNHGIHIKYYVKESVVLNAYIRHPQENSDKEENLSHAKDSAQISTTVDPTDPSNIVQQVPTNVPAKPVKCSTIDKSIITADSVQSIACTDTRKLKETIDTTKKSLVITDNIQSLATTDTVQLERNIDTAPGNATGNIFKFASLRIFWDPTFLVIMLTQGSYAFVITTIWTIIVDYVRDKGIDRSIEVYFVMFLSAADIAGRLSLTWMTDCGYMSRINFSMLCFVCMGVGELLLLWSKGFFFIMSAEIVFAFFAGALVVVFPGVVDDFMYSEDKTVAMASRFILQAPLSLLVSPLIGYFRGSLGSYDGILYLSSSICLVCGGLTLLISYLVKIRKS